MDRLRTRARDSDGFTLIELLVVMVIVGVLAAIAIPSFLVHKRKAYEAAAKSDVEAIAREVASFYVGGSGPLAFRTTADPRQWELATSASELVASGTLSPGNTVGASSAVTSDSNYCVAVVPAATGAQAWKATQDGLDVGGC